MTFEDAVTKILEFEGGYVNDPRDPGGETKYGISKRSYPTLDIANLTKDDAAAIYRRDYWDKCSLDNVPFPLGFVIFDCAVNQGVTLALGLLKLTKNPATYQLLRFQHYAKLKNWPVYGVGWTTRLFEGLEFLWV